jgi:hypothetical protein
MMVRKILLSAAALGALGPVLCQAASEKTAVEACARALADSYSGSAGSAYKLIFHADQPGSVLTSYYSSEYTFTLEARAPKTGVAFARAVCTTNYRGEVVKFSTSAVEPKPATLAGAR